jgi:hypothetical protein
VSSHFPENRPAACSERRIRPDGRPEPTSQEARNWNHGGHGDFFRAPDPFVLFVSFVVKKIPETKTDSTAENVEIAGEFTTKSTKDHEG